MINNTDLNSNAWCDLVFEGKNKKYGAYYLRKTSSKRHLYALIIVIGIVGVTVLLSSFYIHHKKFAFLAESEPEDISAVKFTEYIYLDEQILSKAKTPPPDKKEKQPTPPEIVKDEDFKERIEKQEIKMLFDSINQENADSILTDDLLTLLSPEESKSLKETEETNVIGRKDSVPELQAFQTALVRYVYQNIKYPEVASKQKIQGQVVYSFIVNQDGTLSEITLVKRAYIFLDEEVFRVLRTMPPREPIKKDGKPIRVKCYLPISFSL